MLENYADFILNNLKKQQENPCQTLPTFSQFLDEDEDLVQSVLQGLRHPKNLYEFAF